MQGRLRIFNFLRGKGGIMATGQKLPERRGRVLVADDDPAVRALLIDFLEQQAFEVRAVPDGQTALETFYTEHFDLILVDFRMPGITGLEMATEVRKTAPHIPIALITGTVNAVDSVAIAQAGINRTFLKPFSLDELSSWLGSLHL
jgi:DNA-binding response OmpR family regulator